MTCKGYKTKCFYHTPRTKGYRQCLYYNRKRQHCNLTQDPSNTPDEQHQPTEA